MADALQNYIDGKWVDAIDGERFDVFNPATGEVIATAPDSQPADVERAVDAARRTFDDGHVVAADHRARARPHPAARRRHRAPRARAPGRSWNRSTPASRSARPARTSPRSRSCSSTTAGWATKIYGDIPPVGPDAMSLVVKEPMGVAAAITPWNYPMMMAVQKVAPAIAAGCTIILKPAEQTPLTALEIPKILEEAGPAGRRAERDHRLRRDGRRAAGRAARRSTRSASPARRTSARSSCGAGPTR